jgi:hypothetical protein
MIERQYANPVLIRGGKVLQLQRVEFGAGPVDILCVNADGLLTIIETKLWRNPQSRREVVSQFIDYAAGLAKKTYDDLVDAIRKATGTSGDPLIDRLRTGGQTVDETRFHDAISRNLKRGRHPTACDRRRHPRRGGDHGGLSSGPASLRLCASAC